MKENVENFLKTLGYSEDISFDGEWRGQSKWRKSNWSICYNYWRGTIHSYWGMNRICQNGILVNVISGESCQSQLTDAEYLTYIMILRDIQQINDHLKRLQTAD